MTTKQLTLQGQPWQLIDVNVRHDHKATCSSWQLVNIVNNTMTTWATGTMSVLVHVLMATCYPWQLVTIASENDMMTTRRTGTMSVLDMITEQPDIHGNYVILPMTMTRWHDDNGKNRDDVSVRHDHRATCCSWQLRNAANDDDTMTWWQREGQGRCHC